MQTSANVQKQRNGARCEISARRPPSGSSTRDEPDGSVLYVLTEDSVRVPGAADGWDEPKLGSKPDFAIALGLDSEGRVRSQRGVRRLASFQLASLNLARRGATRSAGPAREKASTHRCARHGGPQSDRTDRFAVGSGSRRSTRGALPSRPRPCPGSH